MPELVDYPVSRAGLVVPTRANLEGGPTRKQVRGPRWRRSSWGFYVPSDVDGDRPEQRIVEASVVALDGVALTGWSSLRWRRGRWFSGLTSGGGRRPVTILIGTRDINPQPAHGITVCGESVSPDMVELLDDVPVTLATWATSFEMRYAANELEAARILSLAAYDDLVSIAEMEEFLSHQRGWTGIPRARDALPYAEENLWSPMEFDMGVIKWSVDRNYDRPLFNRPVFDLHGRHLFTPDCIDPVAGVIGEYNGPSHRASEAYGKDLDRWGIYSDVGLEAVAMSRADLREDGGFGMRLRDAYRRAARRPASDRRWTIEYPDWWVPTHSVDLRRALSPEQKGRFLRYRAS